MSPPPRPADPRVRHGWSSGAAPPDGGAVVAGADADAAVEDAMAGLDGLAGRPPAEHVAVFERIHAALGDALAAAPSAGGTSDRT